jgi:hypothetical protein
VTMNRMRCKPSDGKARTTVRVRELRERLGIAPFDPNLARAETISADAAAIRLGICVGSVRKLIREGVLPATQLMPSAPWQSRSKPRPSRQASAKSSAVVPSCTSAFRRIKPLGFRGSERKDALCRPVPAPAAEYEQIAGMRIALQPLLDLQSQPIHPAPHIGVPGRDPHSHTGIIGATP